jgi:hypothetical protein
VELFEYLKANNVFACGTVRPNRKHLPQMKSDKELQRGEFDFKVTPQGISYFKWRDNRCVHLLSNFHGNESCTLRRKEKDGSEKDVPAPKIVKDYNGFMGGVDKADMLRAMYDCDRKAKKWWHRIFFALMEITLVNSYVIYQELHGKMPLLQFRRQVAQGLLTKGYTLPKKRGRPNQTVSPKDPAKRKKSNFSVPKDIRKQNHGAHWLTFVENRGRCELCASKKIQSRPHSKCICCNVFLCCNEKKNCFYKYHLA